MHRLSAVAGQLCAAGLDANEDDMAKLYPSHIQTVMGAKKRNITRTQTGITIDNIRFFAVEHLLKLYKSMPTYENHFVRTKLAGKGSVDTSRYKYNQIISDDEAVLLDIVRKPQSAKLAAAFVRAGPRKFISWKPGEVVAAVVTCGGLCPGLNAVIEELVNVLYFNYGVDTIFGIRNGYRGFYDKECLPYMMLTPKKVDGISHQGGTILGSSRGGFDLEKIMISCVEYGINQLYIIGGDGTHRAAAIIAQEAIKRRLKISVAGIPKTIDNDIGIIDKSFGFDTAVAESERAIQSAVVEARCSPNGIGIVQLMGRHAGYISCHATLASRQVDLCLVPEVPFELHGRNGIYEHLEGTLRKQGSAVLVVAEGAGGEHVKQSGSTDESGNAVLPEIGLFLRDNIKKYFKSKGKGVAIKYHDPSYMIRSVPANAADSVYCMVLAGNAVHGAMAGYTSFTVATVNSRSVYLPISLVTASSPSYLNPRGRTWERVISTTHQPQKPSAAVKPAVEKAKI